MKTKLTHFILFAVFAGIFSFSAFGQATAGSSTAAAYVVSARAGGVNLVEGRVSVQRAGTTAAVRRGDEISIGERVETGADSRAEVLLNPGSYLRAGSNTSFEFKSTSLDDLEVRLYSGSAIFEVFATNEFTVTLVTPRGTASLVESGVYRVDIDGSGSSKLSVIEGLARVGYKTVVRSGRAASLDGPQATVAKFDKKDRDELAEWSRSRSKDLAKMTSSLKNRSVRDTLIGSFNNGRWSIFDSFGLWVYDPFRGGYCFLPFGRFWSSPYGYNYGLSLYWFNMPPTIHIPPTPPNGPAGPPLIGNGTSIKNVKAAPDLMGPPPYRSIEKSREPRMPAIDLTVPDMSSPIIKQAPMTPSAPVIVAAPSTNRSRKENL